MAAYRAVTVVANMKPTHTVAHTPRKAMVATTVGPRVGRATHNHFEVTLSVDGSGRCTSNTGIASIDAMMGAVAARAIFDLDVVGTVARADDEIIFAEHTCASIGRAAGAALLAATGCEGFHGPNGPKGLRGSGNFSAVHGSAFVIVGIELAPRSLYSVHDGRVVDANNLIITPTFFFLDAVAREAHLEVHILIVSGTNDDVAAATIKGFAMALHDAVQESM